MGNDSTTAFRVREQLRRFVGIFSPQFEGMRRKMEFLGQILFGIQAAKDTLVSEIARALREDCLAKKTQERLERHLKMEDMDERIHGAILCDAVYAFITAAATARVFSGFASITATTSSCGSMS